jgi:hypothetical protein
MVRLSRCHAKYVPSINAALLPEAAGVVNCIRRNHYFLRCSTECYSSNLLSSGDLSCRSGARRAYDVAYAVDQM